MSLEWTWSLLVNLLLNPILMYIIYQMSVNKCMRECLNWFFFNVGKTLQESQPKWTVIWYYSLSVKRWERKLICILENILNGNYAICSMPGG